MLAAAGIIGEDDRDALLAGLDAVAAELDAGRFPFAPDDEDIHMAIERRLTEIAGPVGGRLHTARSRNDQAVTDLAMYTRERARRGAPRLAAARLHPPAARAAGLPRPSPARLRLDAAARPCALRVRRARGRPPAARCGGAGRRQLRHRPGAGRARARLRRGRPELDRRGLQPRLRARLPRRGRRLRDASLAP